jgi:hypothetical protein
MTKFSALTGAALSGPLSGQILWNILLRLNGLELDTWKIFNFVLIPRNTIPK